MRIFSTRAVLIICMAFGMAVWVGTSPGMTDSEWILQRMVPYDIDQFRDIAFSEDGRSGWILGYVQYGRTHSGSAMLRTVDGGQNWVETEIGITNANEAVCFVDDRRGWVVGNKGTIAYTADGGDTWVLQGSSTESRLKDICFVNDSTGWAVGEYSILSTTDGGMLWQGSGIRYTARFNAVFFANDQDGWVVGSGGTVLYTDNGGGSWTTLQTPTNAELYDISFAGASDGWIVGANGTILHSQDEGKTWTSVSGGTTTGLYSIFFPDDSTGWAVGAKGSMLFTQDGGQTWSQRSVAVNTTLQVIQFATSDQAWACGAGGVLLETQDGGESWKHVMNGPNAKLMDVTFLDAKNGWACGWNGTILRTSNGGQTWEPRYGGMDGLLMAIDFHDGDHGWICTFEGSMLATNDAGMNWTLMPSLNGSFRSLDYVDLDDIWIVGERNGLATIFHGLSDGSEWKIQAQVSIGGPLHDVCFADKRRGWAVGSNGTILFTSDSGATWMSQTSGVTSELTHVAAVDPNTAWATGNIGGLLRTADRGENWSLVALDSAYSYGPLCFPSAQQGWVMARAKTDGQVLIWSTADGGDSWQNVSAPAKEGFTALSFASPREGWSVGEKGSIWYFTDMPYHTISGRMAYRDNDISIPDVTIELSGYTSDTMTTDENGRFAFHGLRQGRDFCLSPRSAEMPQRIVTSYDAALILSSLLGRYELDASDSIAADVTGNSKITSFDAANILRHVVGQSVQGLAGTWAFLPREQCFPDVQADQTDISMEGIVYGDVSQNWPGVPGAGVPQVTVMLPHTGAAAGSNFLMLLFAAPINYSCLDSLDIFSYQTQIDYDPSLLQVTALSDSGLVTEAWGPLVYTIDNTLGRLHIAKAGTFPLPWCGSSPAPLVAIQFEVNPRAPSGASATLSLTGTIFNEGTPWAETRDGFFEVIKHSVSGTVSYCSNQQPVPGVTLSLDGDTTTVTAVSDSTGWYLFSNLSRGEDYCLVSYAKTGIPGHVVTSYDASLILRHTSGSFSLGDCGTAAADVNEDGQITTGDARLVSQFAVNGGSQGKIGQWSFTPQERCYDDLPADQTGQDYQAYLYGDVSGNYPQSLIAEECPMVLLGMTDAYANPGATVGVDVVIDTFSTPSLDSLKIYSCDLTLSYDPTFLTALLVSYDDRSTAGWHHIFSLIDTVAGTVTVAMVGDVPLSDSARKNRTLVRVEFYVGKSVLPGTETDIELAEVLVNEGCPVAESDAGQIRIRGKKVSGTVRYCETYQPVEGILLQLTSSSDPESTGTNASGYYVFDDLPWGEQCCATVVQGPSLDADQHVVSVLDAALLFRHVVNMMPFSSCDSIAADVSGDGRITAYDGSIILRYIVSDFANPAGFPPGRTGVWYFRPAQRCVERLLADETLDFEALLYGDVTQNWPGSSVTKSGDMPSVQAGPVKRNPQYTSRVSVPIRVDHPAGVLAADIQIRYNPQDLTAIAARKTPLTADWELASRIGESGMVRIAMAGYHQLEQGGNLVDIEFERTAGVVTEDALPVEILVQLNERSDLVSTIVLDIVGSLSSLPTTFDLRQNYPNPFNPRTEIGYDIPQLGSDRSAFVTITVFNMLGQRVRTLVQETKGCGRYSVAWDGRDDRGLAAGSGIYFYTMSVEYLSETGGSSHQAWTQTKRMLLVK